MNSKPQIEFPFMPLIQPTNQGIIPFVIERSTGGFERSMDLYSRLMEDFVIMIGTPIDDHIANIVVAQLLFLKNKDSDRAIHMWINSPGGSITSGMAIYDTMKYIPNKVYTYSIGLSASMGAFLLAAGEKGGRFALPNSTILIHQPLGGAQGQASDVEIHAKYLLGLKEKLNRLLSENTGQSLEWVEQNTDRDKFLTPEEAREFGIIDHIFTADKTFNEKMDK